MSRARRFDGDFTTTLDDVEIGTWAMDPGIDHDVEADEVFVVLAGRGEVTFDETGEVVTLEPGAVVRLYAGERTTWRVTDPLRKIYITPLESP